MVTKTLRVLVCVLVLASIAVQPASASMVQSLKPSREDPVGVFRDTYATTQADADLEDTSRVRSAIDTYFSIKWQSIVLGTVLDSAFMVDSTSPIARAEFAYEHDLLWYFVECNADAGAEYTAFEYHPIYRTIEAGGVQAKAVLVPAADLLVKGYPPTSTPIGLEEHTITLSKTAVGWQLTADEYENEWTLGYPQGTDFTALVSSLRDSAESRSEARKERIGKLLGQYGDDPRLSERLVNEDRECTMGLRGYLWMDRDDASWYGITYSSNSPGDTSYNKDYFQTATPGDCQNFVSQCIWYGFGGQIATQPIEDRELPMVYNVSGANAWWGTKNHGFSTSWISVSAHASSFKPTVLDNWDNNKVGVQATIGERDLLLEGDVIAQSDWGHVMIVVDVTDRNGNGVLDYSEIYVSGHTTNYKNVQLSTKYSESRIVYLWVMCYKTP